MSDNTETIILSALLHSEDFIRKTLPHIKSEFFDNDTHRTLFGVIAKYRNEYNKTPSFDAIDIELSNSKGISEMTYQSAKDTAEKLSSDQAADAVRKLSFDWLIERTEKYCLDRSVYLAIMKSIDIIDGTEKKVSKDAIPEILQQALAINFDTAIGHDYFDNFEERFHAYHNKEKKILTPLTMMNQITKGGFPRKTLNVLVAGTNVGKSHVLTYFTSQYLMSGLNVLYITLEMAEERIAERIDAALFDVTIDDLKKYNKDGFTNKITKLKQKTHGRLIIKEYPTGSINANNIRFLLDELRVKKDFVPDIITLDYLNLISSYRVRDNSNSYSTMKNVAEELRGLSVEKNLMMLTATQTNRAGQTSSDFELTEVSESHGVSMTADSMFGLIVTEDLEKLSQMRVKVLKNRYGGKSPSSFVISMDRAKMSLADLDMPTATTQNSTPIQQDEIQQINTQTNKSKLSGFKV